MNILDKLFNRFEHDTQLQLDCIDSFVAEGQWYVAEQELKENKSRIYEIINNVKDWSKSVDTFLKRINKNDISENDAMDIRYQLDEILTQGMDKVRLRNKSEIVSVSIGGENVKLSDVINRINNFEKNVDNCFISTIDRFLNDIEEYLNEHIEQYETWINIYNFLTRKRNSLIRIKEDVINIRDDFLRG